MDKFVVKRARTHPSPPDSPSLSPTNLASTRDDSDDNRLIRISRVRRVEAEAMDRSDVVCDSRSSDTGLTGLMCS